MKFKWLLIILLGFSFSNTTFAQKDFTKKGDSDPKAKALLDKLKKQYDGYKSMEVKFDFTLELPKQSPEIQKGSLIQDGQKYQIKLSDQEIYSDGKTIWVHLKKNKQVQITSVDEKDLQGMLSPKQMMRLYETENFVYAITEERVEKGSTLVDIEFKPLDSKSEYIKMRLTVDKSQNKMVALRVFSKDGSKYTLKVDSIIPNKNYDSSAFVFNTKANPGVRIEDLRID